MKNRLTHQLHEKNSLNRCLLAQSFILHFNYFSNSSICAAIFSMFSVGSKRATT